MFQDNPIDYGPWILRDFQTCFQKNPFDLFHLHLILRLPMATLPGSQTTIQVDPSQTLPATPVGNVSSGQRLHVAAALPTLSTGCPQPARFASAIDKASLYVGCSQAKAIPIV